MRSIQLLPVMVCTALAACVQAPGGTPLECSAEDGVEGNRVIRSAGSDARVKATLFLFRGECPAPRQGQANPDVGGRSLAETQADNLVDQATSLVSGDDVALDLAIPLVQQLRPPWSYCARLVFWAEGDLLDQRDVLGADQGGRYAVWPQRAFAVRIAHQDTGSFRVRPYQPVCLQFGPLQGADANADPALYDDDGDLVPNLAELKLGLRPAEADSMDCPAPRPQVQLDGAMYLFGSGSADALSNEQDNREGRTPAVAISVGGFQMDTTEVTNRQYRVCMGTVVEVDGRRQYACSPPRVFDVFSAGEQKLAGPTFDAHPVVGVSHEQARRFCELRGMRLPTEAEWERAARFADGMVHDNPFSGELPTDANTCVQGRFYTQAAGGSLTPCSDNAVMDTGAVVKWDGTLVTARSAAWTHNGIVDLAGNAAEWTQDEYERDLHERMADTPGVITAQELGRSVHTVRGGSFRSGPRFVRGYARAGVDEAAAGAASALLAVGFRCVR